MTRFFTASLGGKHKEGPVEEKNGTSLGLGLLPKGLSGQKAVPG